MQQLRHCAAACLIILVVLAAWSSPAAAHTGFESSDPADGAVLDSPVEVITLVFTGDAEPTGSGFEVLEPSGELRQPTDASSVDALTWVLRFDPPLSGGVVGVRWMVKAPDAHPIDGSFSFTTPDAIPLLVEGAEPALEPEAASAADDEPADERAAVEAAVVDDTPTVLEEFLETDADPGRSAQRIGAIGRFVTLAGTLIGVGGLAFVATAMRGRRSEVRHVLFWVRRAGVIVMTGAIIEFVAQIVIEDAGNWKALWSPSMIGGVAWSTFGIATALRLGGGLGLAMGSRLGTASASDVADPVAAVQVLVGAGSTAADRAGGFWGDAEPVARDGGVGSEPKNRGVDYAWRPGTDSAGAVVGAAAVIAAYSFDGHTVTKGNRFLTGAVDAIHVAGGAIWAGGIVMLVSVLWLRHREGRDLRARHMATRFSVVASAALVAVGVAGVLLTIIVLDSPSELWSTEWGRILIAKTTFVAIAALAGGYNHKILIPQLDTAPDDTELAHRFRNVVTGESLALVVVAILTAILMGAAS